jgi:hypothetical protein
MKKSWWITGAAVLLVLTSGCGKKSPAEPPNAEAPALVEKAAPLASHLGFATRVPKDADLFMAGYHADKMLDGLVKTFIKPEEMESENMEKFRDAMTYVGDEMFLFVGPGAGGQIEMIGTTYRDMSAAWAGFAVGTLLDAMANKDATPDFSKLSEGLSDDLLGKWIDAFEKDARLRLPSVVMGWKPAAEKEAECRETVVKLLDDVFISEKKAKPVTFEASGVALAGYEIPGRDAFGELIAKAREEMSQQAGNADLLEKITPEQMERILTAMENVRFTIAAGSLEGRILIYIGNGSEGFNLAKTPAESLAASEDLTWTGGFADKRITGTLYLSEAMVRSVLPLLDSSSYWDSVSSAIRPPVREERLFRELLTGLAGTERELAKRDASAWSAIAFEDSGWHLESRGGWPDPDLDYTTPLRMTEAAAAQKPAVRAHWIQQRGRKDLAWKRLEIYGHLIDSVIGELNASENPMMAMLPEGTMDRITKEIVGLNHAYRNEFRAGIGDEVAMIADFQGEVPPIPGISEETVKSAKAPRFLIARPVRDRAMLSASGKSFVQSWRSLTAWASEQSGENLPLIVPQSIESGGLITWYAPLPFIGGDFMPGVTLNDELWMLGTSRSMAGGFSKSMASSGSGGETGMIVEIDFAPVRDWATDLYQRNEADAKALTADAPDEMMELANKENLERANAAIRRLQGLSYRHWMADGKPRTSLHVRIGAAE